jgi:glycerol-3-phosphate acyltransferase PlsX
LSADAGVNFYGNVEGRDLIPAPVDVIVTDGFTGNVALKTLEGALQFVFTTVLTAIDTNDETRAAGRALAPFLMPTVTTLTPEHQGGAMLLGLNGICVISHGASNDTAIMNALRVAAEMDAAGVVEKMRTAIRPDESQ